CTISGTPSVVTSNTTYTVTANISGTTYQGTVWLSSAYELLTPSVEGADLLIDEAMTNITFQYNASAASGSGSGSGTSATTTYGNGSTWQVADIETGPNSSSPMAGNPPHRIVVDDTLYFTADDGITGRELWAYNTSNETTWLVSDINQGPNSSSPNGFELFGQTIYFFAYTDTTGPNMWAYNVLNDTRWQLTDLNTYGITIPNGWVTVFNIADTLYFRGDNGTGGDLWAYNLSNNTPWQVSDTRVSGDAQPGQYIWELVGDTIYFDAIMDNYNDRQLWAYDTSNQSRWHVTNFHFDNAGHHFSMVIDDTIYFDGNDGITGIEPWAYNTTNGTIWQLANINQDVPEDILGHSYPAMGQSSARPDGTTGPYIIGDSFYFDAKGPSGHELYGYNTSNQTVWQATDIASGKWTGELGSPQGHVFGDKLIFYANNGSYGAQGSTGFEWWIHDTSNNSTWVVTNIGNGYSRSGPTQAILVGDTLYFHQTDCPSPCSDPNSNGSEMWAHDISNESTWQVADIWVGNGSGYFQSPILVGDTILFRAIDGITGWELWAHQPSEITSIPNISSSDSSGGMTNVNGAVCTVSPALPTGLNIDSSTCTISGTPSVVTSNTTYTVTANISGTIYQGTVWLATMTFGTITSPVMGAELDLGEAMTPITLNYTSQAGNATVYNGNGTAWQVKNIGIGTTDSQNATGGASSDPRSLTALGNTVFFVANDKTHNHNFELWKSDGTESGTVMVKDINPNLQNSAINELTVMGDTLYFTANDGTHGVELWKSDGTESGTVMVKDIYNGSSTGAYGDLTVVGNTLYFSANDGTHGVELWKSDGTESGTVMVKDIQSGIQNGLYYNPSDLVKPVSIGNTLYFSANDGTHGFELWKSDGTASGTVMVKEIYNGTHPTYSPESLTVVGNTLFFFQQGNQPDGYGLFKSDGTESGTVRVLNIRGSNGELVAIGNTVYFVHTDQVGPQINRELWKSDGTASGTVMVKDITTSTGGSQPDQLTAVGDTLYFRALVSANSGLYKSDGTASGTVLITDALEGIQYMTPFGNTLYFSATYDGGLHVPNLLYKSDGTESGTVIVSNYYPKDPTNLAVVGNTLYFQGDTYTGYAIDDTELWALDPANIVLNTPPAVSWEIHPELPEGMTLVNGVISGTPTVYAVNQTYTIYANQSGETTTFDMYFSVDTNNPHTVVENQPIDAIGFQDPFQNGVTNWTVSPALPADLVMDPNTGDITGSVNGVLANTTYTVTATHSDGATETFTFSLQSLADFDGDGLANELPSDYDTAEGPTSGLVADTDDDADGLEDVVETGTSIYVDSNNTGSNPLDPDTDDDGICDGPNAVPPICIAGPDSTPNGDSGPPIWIGLFNKEGTVIGPYKSLPGGTYEIMPDLPQSLAMDPNTGVISGTPTQTLENTTFTVWVNRSDGASLSWNFSIEILADRDGDGFPDELPDDYDPSNPTAPGLVEDLDDDN
ncbi:MAG: ELWxxDGT repeat protein, partial [Candidatus Thermoplasmatota archaeon]|nr:ELWxxDGT repeat protein [Candidatus Thermoplasmatota archaeon]